MGLKILQIGIPIVSNQLLMQWTVR